MARCFAIALTSLVLMSLVQIADHDDQGQGRPHHVDGVEGGPEVRELVRLVVQAEVAAAMTTHPIFPV